MGAFGRILQVIGWLWLAFAFFGPMFNLPRLDIFPGIIIVFVARVFRAQATRRERADAGEMLQAETRPQQVQPRKPRRETPRVESPVPPTESKPKPKPKPTPSSVRPEPKMPDAAEREVMLEKILLTGQELAEESVEEQIAVADETPQKMSSAEMIARAHERWNKKS